MKVEQRCLDWFCSYITCARSLIFHPWCSLNISISLCTCPELPSISRQWTVCSKIFPDSLRIFSWSPSSYTWFRHLNPIPKCNSQSHFHTTAQLWRRATLSLRESLGSPCFPLEDHIHTQHDAFPLLCLGCYEPFFPVTSVFRQLWAEQYCFRVLVGSAVGLFHGFRFYASHASQILLTFPRNAKVGLRKKDFS